MAHRSFLLKGEWDRSAVGFGGASSDFNLIPSDEIHIYFFSLVYLKNKNKNKTSNIFHFSKNSFLAA